MCFARAWLLIRNAPPPCIFASALMTYPKADCIRRPTGVRTGPGLGTWMNRSISPLTRIIPTICIAWTGYAAPRRGSGFPPMAALPGPCPPALRRQRSPRWERGTCIPSPWIRRISIMCWSASIRPGAAPTIVAFWKAATGEPPGSAIILRRVRRGATAWRCSSCMIPPPNREIRTPGCSPRRRAASIERRTRVPRGRKRISFK